MSYRQDREPADHFEAKSKVCFMLQLEGLVAKREYPLPSETAVGHREYRVDIWVEDRQGRPFIVEIDGGIHQKTSQRFKDKVRDEHFANVGLRTIRFDVEAIVGKYSQPAAWIMDQILPRDQQTIDWSLQE